jgi:hypothetical protein
MACCFFCHELPARYLHPRLSLLRVAFAVIGASKTSKKTVASEYEARAEGRRQEQKAMQVHIGWR